MLGADRSLEPVQGDVIIVALDGDLICKILDKQRQRLLAANPPFPAILILDEQSVVIDGVVKAHSGRIVDTTYFLPDWAD